MYMYLIDWELIKIINKSLYNTVIVRGIMEKLKA